MDSRNRFVVVFLTVLNAFLTLLLCGLVRDTRNDVGDLKQVLATKQDLVNVAAPRLTLFHEEKCTTCHSERRFAGDHNVRGEIERAVAHMGQMPDAPFTQAETAKIHASLEIFRCSQCHDLDQLRRLAIKSPAERMRLIGEMIARPGSRISPDETARILRAFEQMFGF
jgi:hypothetical protein